MVLSVEHILTSGLIPDVLPANAALRAAVVARFERARNVRVTGSQRRQLSTEPDHFAVEIRKPPAMAVMGPHQTGSVFEPAVAFPRMSTHWSTGIASNCSRIVLVSLARRCCFGAVECTTMSAYQRCSSTAQAAGPRPASVVVIWQRWGDERKQWGTMAGPKKPTAAA